MTSRRAAALTLAVVALGVFAEWASLRRAPLQEPVGGLDLRLAGADLATGIVLTICGAVAWARRPANRIGMLLLASAVAWFLGTFASSGDSGFADFGSPFVTLHRGLLFHAIVAYPDGRLRGRIDRAVVAAAYITAAIADVGSDSVVTIVIAGLVFAAVARGYATASARSRVALRPALGGAAAVGAALVTASALDLHGASAATDRATLAAYEIAIGTSVLWFVLSLLRGRWTQSTVTGLVVDLGAAGGSPLRDRLAHVLGDSSVVVGYRVPGRDGFVDADGRGIELPPAGSTRELTYVGGDERLGVLIHDSGSIDDPALLEPVAAATRIAVSNVQLQSAIRGQLEELMRSRRRIVEAGDAQRRRLEQRLHDGAQARLARVHELLEDAPAAETEGQFDAMLAETLAEVDRARDELSEFARGVRPPVLSEGGLDAALADLGRRAAVPVTVSSCGERFAPAVEAAAYFVCAEALANIGKYARASHASVTAGHAGGCVTVEVIDDGVGGADLSAGSGLRGLRDRVEALGGTLGVDSPAGGGTRVSASLPVA